MEENTDALSNAPITDDSAVEQIAEELRQEPIEQEPVNEAPVAPVEPEAPTRSERREQNYIDKLSDQIRNSGYGRRSDNQESGRTNDYQPIKYEEGEYDPTQLEKDREAYGQYQRQQAYKEAESRIDPLRQEMWADRLELDNERVQKTWDILDESGDNFDPDFADGMTKKYLNFIGYRQDQNGQINIDRPNVRWLDFVRAEKQNFDRYVARAKETSTKNIVKQAANTGIRPSGQSRTTSHRDVDTSDPNWISKLSREEYDTWGRELADKVINERLGIK